VPVMASNPSSDAVTLASAMPFTVVVRAAVRRGCSASRTGWLVNLWPVQRAHHRPPRWPGSAVARPMSAGRSARHGRLAAIRGHAAVLATFTTRPGNCSSPTARR
jgi:hypothetical protein